MLGPPWVRALLAMLALTWLMARAADLVSRGSPQLLPDRWDVGLGCVAAGLVLARAAWVRSGRRRVVAAVCALAALVLVLAPWPTLGSGGPWLLMSSVSVVRAGTPVLVDQLGCSGQCRAYVPATVVAAPGEDVPVETWSPVGGVVPTTVPVGHVVLVVEPSPRAVGFVDARPQLWRRRDVTAWWPRWLGGSSPGTRTDD